MAATEPEKTVYLVRHGQAMSKEENPERPLTDEGVQAARNMAQWAASAGLRVDEICHSGKRRAQQTAEFFTEQLLPGGEAIEATGLGAKDDVQPIADWLKREQKTYMLVGHQPFLGNLVGYLLAGNEDVSVAQFEAAGLAILVEEDGQWVLAGLMQPDLLP